MATTKPRVTVTLEPHRYALLKRLSELQGVSMSYLLVDLLEAVAPVLERVAVAIASAQLAQESVKPHLIRSAQKAEAQLMPMMDQALSHLDAFIRQAQQAAATGEGTRAVGEGSTVAAGDQPPSSNTGVRSGKEGG